MAEQLILFQTEELSGIKARYSGLAEEMQEISNHLRTVEGRLNGCLSAMESVVGSGGRGEYFHTSAWVERQCESMGSILSAIQKAVDLTVETNGSLQGKIAGTPGGTVAGPAVGSGDTTVQTVTSIPSVAAAAAAVAGLAGLTGAAGVFGAVTANAAPGGAGAAASGAGAAGAVASGAGAAGAVASGAGAAGAVASGAGAAVSAGAAASGAAASAGAAAKPKQTTIGKNMDRKTSIKTKSASGKTVTVKGTYDVVKNVDKFALDQRKYSEYACTGTAWAMTRNINDGKTTIKPLDKSNWGSSGCKWPGSKQVTGSNQSMLSAAYSQLQQGKVCTIYGKHPVSGKSQPHAVTIIGVKPTADPKKLKISDFLVIDPWGGTTKNMSDVKYTKLTKVVIDKT